MLFSCGTVCKRDLLFQRGFLNLFAENDSAALFDHFSWDVHDFVKVYVVILVADFNRLNHLVIISFKSSGDLTRKSLHFRFLCRP